MKKAAGRATVAAFDSDNNVTKTVREVITKIMFHRGLRWQSRCVSR